MSNLFDGREHYTAMRDMRLYHPDVVAGSGRFTGKTRNRVLMFPTWIGGTRRNSGTILNIASVRKEFAGREARQDATLDWAIAEFDRCLEKMEELNVPDK